MIYKVLIVRFTFINVRISVDKATLDLLGVLKPCYRVEDKVGL